MQILTRIKARFAAESGGPLPGADVGRREKGRQPRRAARPAMTPGRKWELSVLLGLVLALGIGNFAQFSAACASVRDNTLRLHILANSDSAEDQALKLAVRDAILAEEGQAFAAAGSKAGAVYTAGVDLEAIERAARGALAARGCGDPVSVRLENMYFETREYDGFTLPAGRYDAVRVEIGAHAGENWFCVLFPPLCVPAAEGGQGAAQGGAADYSSEQRAAVESACQLRFAAVELFESLREKLRGGTGQEPDREAAEAQLTAKEKELLRRAAEAEREEAQPPAGEACAPQAGSGAEQRAASAPAGSGAGGPRRKA